MNLRNYTSGVPVDRSIAAIETLLVQAGALGTRFACSRNAIFNCPDPLFERALTKGRLNCGSGKHLFAYQLCSAV